MLEQQDDHSQLFDDIAFSVCSKPPGISAEECFESKSRKFCRKAGQCRIFEKTEQQLRYVNSSLEEKIFLTACPGSGKTEVVGLKAAYETKNWEQKRSGIAFLTFTNNATSVIRDRVIQVAGVDVVGYPHYIGTIDSWLHRYIAHPFAHRITGYIGEEGDGSIRIVENSSNVGFLNNYQSRLPINRRNIKANQFYIDLTTGNIVFWSGNNQLDLEWNNWQLKEWQIRQLKTTKWKLLQSGFATYQDIELICHKVLDISEIAGSLALRFPYMIIDECQDLSKNQLVLINQLVEAGVFVHFVGDLDQSIYSFKGVEPEAINDFILENDFSRQELADNFRSPQLIVDLCSRLVNKEEVIGRREQVDTPMCVYLTYDNESEMSNLPERFCEILDGRDGVDTENSAILARNYNTIGKIRSHSNSGQKKKAYFPAIAISAWNNPNRSLEQTEEAFLLMGKYLAERLFTSKPSNSRRYYCPESVSSPIQWRVFLARVLSACCGIAELINFQQTWREWAGNFRNNIEVFLPELASEFDTITLPDNIRGALDYRAPTGKSTEAVSESIIAFPDNERMNIRITTFHKIKGETLDAALVVSSQTMQGGGGGHWQKWLEDPTHENARFAYVASSRPKYFLAWAVPVQSLENGGKGRLEELGFIEFNAP